MDYNTIQFKWAKEIMKDKNINIIDINWNKFKTKNEINEFINTLIDSIEIINESDNDD